MTLTHKYFEKIFRITEIAFGNKTKNNSVIRKRRIIMKKITLLSALLALTIVMTGCSSSETSNGGTGEDSASYPSQPIQTIITANAGGGVDVTARITGKYAEEILGQSLVPVNVAGAGGATGAQQALDADADGYTVLYTTDAIITMHQMGMSEFDYTAFKPVGIHAEATNMTFVTSNEFQTFEEFVEYAKANPGELKFGVQTGTYSEQLAAMMWKDLGIEIQIIDIGTISDIVVALVGGHIDMAAGPMGNMADYVENGDFVAHGMLSQETNPDYAEIPTMYELGVNFHLPRFYLYLFEAEVSDEIVKTFADAIYEVSQNPDYQAEISEQAYTPRVMTMEETLTYIQETEEVYTTYQKTLEEYRAQ